MASTAGVTCLKVLTHNLVQATAACTGQLHIISKTVQSRFLPFVFVMVNIRGWLCSLLIT